MKADDPQLVGVLRECVDKAVLLQNSLFANATDEEKGVIRGTISDLLGIRDSIERHMQLVNDRGVRLTCSRCGTPTACQVLRDIADEFEIEVE